MIIPHTGKTLMLCRTAVEGAVCLCVNVCTWPCRYACYLYFQLRTHHDMFCGDDEDEEPVMTFPGALAVLTGITVAVAVCSE